LIAVGGFLLFIALVLTPISQMVQNVTVAYNVQPEGIFYINNTEISVWEGGKISTKVTSFNVSSPDLNFKFMATAAGDAISYVDIKYNLVGEPTWYYLNLTKGAGGQEWTGSLTLSKIGKWSVLGRVFWAGTGAVVMSISAMSELNETEITVEEEYPTTEISLAVPLTLGLIGLVLIVFGLVIKTKAKRR